MTLEELIAALRLERLDDTAEPFLYDDDRLTRALNDAVRQAAIRKRLMLDRNSQECCRYPVAIEQSEVLLHPRVLAIRSARFTGRREPLVLTTLKVMDKDRPAWPDEASGEPTHLIVDAQSGAVLLWPTPNTAGSLSLSVWRTPLEVEEMESGDDEPVIDEPFHADLLDWAEHMAFQTKDGELGDAKRSELAEARFTEKFGPLPSAHEIKCWGLAPRRGQRAQFI